MSRSRTSDRTRFSGVLCGFGMMVASVCCGGDASQGSDASQASECNAGRDPGAEAKLGDQLREEMRNQASDALIEVAIAVDQPGHRHCIVSVIEAANETVLLLPTGTVGQSAVFANVTEATILELAARSDVMAIDWNYDRTPPP